MPASKDIRIRMYRQGLGDAFLIRFPKVGGGNFHVLIDCGVFVGTTNQSANMRAIAADVKTETGAKLDILIATHQHWDHLSGFQQAREIWDTIAIEELWLGWTEEPGNPVADELRGERTRLRIAARAAVAEMNARGANANLRAGIAELLNFFGEAPAAGAARDGTDEALDYLKSRAANVRYCHPKDAPRELPGVRAYVLGPPENAALVRQSEVSSSRDEIYNLTFGAALTGSAPERNSPFDGAHSLSSAQAKTHPFFKDRYGFGAGAKEAWRRIEDDWLDTAGELALKLDSDTNNTSLVLAFECVAAGEVLLFAADAQVGNWLSWSDCGWKIPGPRATTKTITGPDLMKRTVLYKVGHHGSENATLRAKGLELMTSDQLVAMITVGRKKAAAQGWAMPYEPMFKELKKKTRGRILIADDGLPAATDLAGLTTAARKRFLDAVKVAPLWIDYTITPKSRA